MRLPRRSAAKRASYKDSFPAEVEDLIATTSSEDDDGARKKRRRRETETENEDNSDSAEEFKIATEEEEDEDESDDLEEEEEEEDDEEEEGDDGEFTEEERSRRKVNRGPIFRITEGGLDLPEEGLVGDFGTDENAMEVDGEPQPQLPKSKEKQKQKAKPKQKQQKERPSPAPPSITLPIVDLEPVELTAEQLKNNSAYLLLTAVIRQGFETKFLRNFEPQLAILASTSTSSSTSPTASTSTQPTKKRGRPRKNALPDDGSSTSTTTPPPSLPPRVTPSAAAPADSANTKLVQVSADANGRFLCPIPGCGKDFGSVPAIKYHFNNFVHDTLAFLEMAYPENDTSDLTKLDVSGFEQESGVLRIAQLAVEEAAKPFRIHPTIKRLFTLVPIECPPIELPEYPIAVPGLSRLQHYICLFGTPKDRLANLRKHVKALIKQAITRRVSTSREVTRSVGGAPRTGFVIKEVGDNEGEGEEEGEEEGEGEGATKITLPSRHRSATANEDDEGALTGSAATRRRSNKTLKVNFKDVMVNKRVMEDYKEIDDGVFAAEKRIFENVDARRGWAVLPAEQAQLYLPAANPLKINHGKRGELDILSATTVQNFESVTLETNSVKKDGFIFNAGVSVWAMEWAQRVTSDKQYLLLGGYEKTLGEHHVLNRPQATPRPNALQLYALTPASEESEPPRPKSEMNLSVVLCHEWGVCYDLKFLEVGGYVENQRVGIVAAAFGDGIVRVFAVPSPSLFANAGQNGIVYLKCQQPLLELQIPKFMLWRVCWLGSDALMTATPTGEVAIWNLATCLVSPGPHQPDRFFPAQDSGIFCLESASVYSRLHCNSDTHVNSLYETLPRTTPLPRPHQLLTGGVDGGLYLRDIRDHPGLAVPLHKQTGFVYCAKFALRDSFIFYADQDTVLAFRLDNMSNKSSTWNAPGNLYDYSIVSMHRGLIWDIDVSPFMPFVASCSVDGTVKLANYFLPYDRYTRAASYNLYRVSYNHGEDVYTFYEEKQSLSVSDTKAVIESNIVEVFDPHQQIQKVKFCPKLSVGGWVASAGTAGFVRVECVV